MFLIVFLTALALVQGADYNPEFPDQSGSKLNVVDAAPDGPFAIKGIKGQTDSNVPPESSDATLRESVRSLRPFRILDRSEIRLFMTKVFELLTDKCVTLNAEKMAHIQMFLEKFPSRRVNPANQPFQRLIDSISRCTSKPTVPPVEVSTVAPTPNSTNDSGQDTLTEHHHVEFFFSFKMPSSSWLPMDDLFGSGEETNPVELTTEAPSSGFKNKLKALKRPIVNWMSSTWIKVKDFFHRVFNPNKQPGPNNGNAEPGDENPRGRRDMAARNLLDEAWSPSGQTFHLRQVLKMILNEIFRIYGHSCPDALTHVPAFKSAARSTLRHVMQSDFIESGAAKLLDDEFMSELIECGELEVVSLDRPNKQQGQVQKQQEIPSQLTSSQPRAAAPANVAPTQGPNKAGQKPI